MQFVTRIAASAERRLRSFAAVAFLPLLSAVFLTPAGAQPPLTPPVTGDVATEGTVDQVYSAGNAVAVTTADGVHHVFRFTKDLLVHGGKSSGEDALKDLREGSTVVVHYSVQGSDEAVHEIDHVGGDEGLLVTEGVVTRIDRGGKQIIVRFDDGTIETLRLTDRAAAEGTRDADRAATEAGRVAVYYTDEAGKKVVHFFKPVKK
jgi:hypothetical protein